VHFKQKCSGETDLTCYLFCSANNSSVVTVTVIQTEITVFLKLNLIHNF